MVRFLDNNFDDSGKENDHFHDDQQFKSNNPEIHNNEQDVHYSPDNNEEVKNTVNEEIEMIDVPSAGNFQLILRFRWFFLSALIVCFAFFIYSLIHSSKKMVLKIGIEQTLMDDGQVSDINRLTSIIQSNDFAKQVFDDVANTADSSSINKKVLQELKENYSSILTVEKVENENAVIVKYLPKYSEESLHVYHAIEKLLLKRAEILSLESSVKKITDIDNQLNAILIKMNLLELQLANFRQGEGILTLSTIEKGIIENTDPNLVEQLKEDLTIIDGKIKYINNFLENSKSEISMFFDSSKLYNNPIVNESIQGITRVNLKLLLLKSRNITQDDLLTEAEDKLRTNKKELVSIIKRLFQTPITLDGELNFTMGLNRIFLSSKFASVNFYLKNIDGVGNFQSINEDLQQNRIDELTKFQQDYQKLAKERADVERDTGIAGHISMEILELTE